MGSQTQTSVSNIALLQLGVQQQISSLNEDSPQANACVTLFAYCYENLARMARWGCLKKQANLTLVQAAKGTNENPNGTTLPWPQQPWLYAYLYPADCLFVRQIFPPVCPNQGTGTPQMPIGNSVTSAVGKIREIPYETGYSTDLKGNPIEVILTNQDQAVANYTVNQPNPASWDALFTDAFVSTLAAKLVPALSLDKQLMQLQLGIAKEAVQTARAWDANENPSTQNHIPDWIRARSGATGRLMGREGYNAYGSIFGGNFE